MPKIILSVCLLVPNGDPVEAVLVLGGIRMFPVKLEARGLTWELPSPDFVQEFLSNLSGRHDMVVVVVGGPILSTPLAS